MLIFDKKLKVLPTAGHRDPGSAVSATSRRGGGPAPSLGAPGRQSPAQPPLPWPLGSIRPSLFSKARCSALRARGEGTAAAEEGVGAGRSTDAAGRLREGGGRRGNLPSSQGKGRKKAVKGAGLLKMHHFGS